MKIDRQYIPGARIYKTFIAVMISLLLSRYVFHASGFYMTVAVILAMKDSPEKTKTYGRNRILGTIIGGVIGYFILLFIRQTQIEADSFAMLLMNGISIFLLLWLSKLLKTGESMAAMGCVVLFSITLIRFDEPILSYVTDRVIETAMGVVISMIINDIDLRRTARKMRLKKAIAEANKLEEKEIEDK
ncbi:MAG: FUSC family protein [Coprobacillaceae bacterium]